MVSQTSHNGMGTSPLWYYSFLIILILYKLCIYYINIILYPIILTPLPWCNHKKSIKQIQTEGALTKYLKSRVSQNCQGHEKQGKTEMLT